MRPSELHRAVARATGETVNTIDRMGFQHVIVPLSRVRQRFSMRRRRRPDAQRQPA